MRLTGIPLILLAATATGAIVAATVRFWRTGRPAIRIIGILVAEALTVLTVGLVVNRQEQFYPSWQALRGDTGTVAVTERRQAGRLDEMVRSRQLTWRPPGLAAWHLSRPPTVTLPRDYRERPGMAFPVVLAVGRPARPAGEAVTVTIAPTAHTTAASLRRLPLDLAHDLRVTTTGWDVVGTGPLAAGFVAAAPAGLAVLNQPVDALPPPLAAPLRLPS